MMPRKFELILEEEEEKRNLKIEALKLFKRKKNNSTSLGCPLLEGFKIPGTEKKNN